MSPKNAVDDRPRFTLRQLDIMLAIVREGSTAAAAERLFLSQSAVSAALKNLEATYGVALFDRIGRRLVLSRTGERLWEGAAALLEHAREFEQSLTGHQDIADLTLGASFTIANHLAIDYLAKWLERYPDARIDIVPGNSPDIVGRVINQQVDIGLIEDEMSHPMLHLTPWLDDELVVFCSPGHRLAAKGRLSEKDIVNERWILREKDSGARQRYDQTFSRLLPDLKLYLEFRHNEPIRRAVEQGLGIGCLSEKVLASHFESGALVPLRLPAGYQMQRRFFICTRRDGYQRAAVASFVALCLDGLPSRHASRIPPPCPTPLPQND
jgi:DNA-binding transcriptional LysR family regulator